MQSQRSVRPARSACSESACRLRPSGQFQAGFTLKAGDQVDVVALKSTGVVEVAKDLSAKSVDKTSHHQSDPSSNSAADWSGRGSKR
jgi:hypothetical protein